MPEIKNVFKFLNVSISFSHLQLSSFSDNFWLGEWEVAYLSLFRVKIGWKESFVQVANTVKQTFEKN
jgi:hypothetical protein